MAEPRCKEGTGDTKTRSETQHLSAGTRAFQTVLPTWGSAHAASLYVVSQSTADLLTAGQCCTEDLRVHQLYLNDNAMQVPHEKLNHMPAGLHAAITCDALRYMCTGVMIVTSRVRLSDLSCLRRSSRASGEVGCRPISGAWGLPALPRGTMEGW